MSARHFLLRSLRAIERIVLMFVCAVAILLALHSIGAAEPWAPVMGPVAIAILLLAARVWERR